MSAYTPGPWSLHQEAGWPWPYYIESASSDYWVVRMQLDSYSTADTKESANARDGNELIHANARLIAAAPELLEALMKCHAEMSGLPRSLGYDITHLPHIEALIAKATGGQP